MKVVSGLPLGTPPSSRKIWTGYTPVAGELPARLVDRDVHVDAAVRVAGQVGQGDGATARLVVRAVELAPEGTLELRPRREPGVDVHRQHFAGRV